MEPTYPFKERFSLLIGVASASLSLVIIPFSASSPIDASVLNMLDMDILDAYHLFKVSGVAVIVSYLNI
ncbi:MAG: hypothetical protein JRI72_11185 [Deltaproteobacteria bacterium]|nr:hypothetical protein [Deltaproteobacteria bacterium]